MKKKIGYLDDDSYDFISMYGEELNFPNLTKKYFTDILIDFDNKMKKKKNVEQAFKILGINKKDDACFIEATNKYYQNEALIYKNSNDKKQAIRK